MTDAPPRAKPRRLGLKIGLGLVLVAGLVLGTGAIVDNLGSPPTYVGLPPPAAATAADQLDPAAFSRQLSQAGGAADPAAFVALFAPELQDSAGRWHRNVHTLGADQVLTVLRTSDVDALREDSFDAVLEMGFHIPGIDGVEVDPREPLAGMGVVSDRMPASQYTVTIRRTEDSGIIEAWAPPPGLQHRGTSRTLWPGRGRATCWPPVVRTSRCSPRSSRRRPKPRTTRRPCSGP